MTGLVPPVLDGQRVDLMLSTPLVRPPAFREGTTLGAVVLTRNEIIVFDGPAGTGKTTTARYVANRCKRPCAVVTIPQTNTPTTLLRLIHVAVTGAEHLGSEYDMTNDLIRVLAAWGGVLVIDEMHLCGMKGLHTIVHLYEATLRAFAVVMVGSGVKSVVDAYDNLSTRVSRPWTSSRCAATTSTTRSGRWTRGSPRRPSTSCRSTTTGRAAASSASGSRRSRGWTCSTSPTGRSAARTWRTSHRC